MTDVLLRMLIWVSVGLALVLLLRRPVRHAFGAGQAFMLWLLPVVLALAPLVPRSVAPAAVWSLPALAVTPYAASSASAAAVDWVQWLVALWMLGAAIGIVRLAVCYLRLRHAAWAAPSAWSHWLAEAVPCIDLRRVRLHADGPAVLWSLPRTLVLLPADFAPRFGNAATRAVVLRHELTHVRRGDAWWSLAMEIAAALLWFHPLAWIARSRFRLDMELVCDAASLRKLPHQAAGYARALLDSVATQPTPALIPWLARPQLKERIAMLAKVPPGALRRRTGTILIAALPAGGVVLAGAQVRAQAKPPSSAPAVSAPVSTAEAATNAAAPHVDVAYKNAHLPAYPKAAANKGLQGTVILDVTVDKHGRVTSVVVDRHSPAAPKILQRAAVKAARGWKYNPGVRNGKPVGGVVKIPVHFTLNSYAPCEPGQAHAKGAKRCPIVPPASPP